MNMTGRRDLTLRMNYGSISLACQANQANLLQKHPFVPLLSASDARAGSRHLA